jgi:Uncharacterized conserved protein
MENKYKIETSTEDREIFLTRLLKAPREVVFKAWTDPEQVVQWWGPDGFTTTNKEMNVSPGGIWRYTMHGPDGIDYPNRVEYIEVAEPERLVYLQCGEEPFDDIEFHVTVLFEKEGNNTRLIMRSVFQTKEELDRVVKEYGALEGAKQHAARLEKFLEGKV